MFNKPTGTAIMNNFYEVKHKYCEGTQKKIPQCPLVGSVLFCKTSLLKVPEIN